jgi:biopolymer transport protein ExbD
METEETGVLFFKQILMAQLNPTENIRHKKDGSRIKKSEVRIDMTPMVDLGFLLICFFVFTTSMSEPKVTDLFMPKDGPVTPFRNSFSMTVLLGNNNKVFCYDGMWNEALLNNAIIQTNYSIENGVGSVIRTKQKNMNLLKNSKDARKDLMLIIKATKDASYKHLMNVLDEVLINDVRHYAIVDPTDEEINYLKR